MKKTVLITGASGGIGKLLMGAFIDKGYNVQGTYNSSEPDAELSDHYVQVNITDYEAVKSWVDSSICMPTEIILINCAGITYNAMAHRSKNVEWKKVIEVNLIGSFNAISSVLPYMREMNYGRIINFSSVAGQKGVPGTSSYAASKSGLWGMTKAIAVENASKNITINNINLGYMNIGMINMVPKDIQEIIKSDIPAKTFGKPVEIINTINYIMDSQYLTGTSIDLNGGLF